METSGSSIVGYKTILGPHVDTKVWSDADGFGAYEAEYPETRAEQKDRLPSLEMAKKKGVDAYVVVPTTVCKLTHYGIDCCLSD